MGKKGKATLVCSIGWDWWAKGKLWNRSPWLEEMLPALWSPKRAINIGRISTIVLEMCWLKDGWEELNFTTTTCSTGATICRLKLTMWSKNAHKCKLRWTSTLILPLWVTADAFRIQKYSFCSILKVGTEQCPVQIMSLSHPNLMVKEKGSVKRPKQRPTKIS